MIELLASPYTIGGNDAGLSSVITECALAGWASDCNGAIDEAPFLGHAVRDGGSGSSTEWINGLSNPVGESLHPKVSGHAGGYDPGVHAVTG